MNSKHVRTAGILLHITSLPSEYGIGDLGMHAYRAADWIHKAGMQLWQILPLGPTGFGNSPYAPRSTFAGNEMMISLDMLAEQGLLSSQVLEAHPNFPADHVDFDQVQRWKLPLLKQAAKAFLHSAALGKQAYLDFCRQQQFWLDDYASFMVLYEQFQDARWFSHWPTPLGKRTPAAMQVFEEEHASDIAIWKVLQFFFEQQWIAFKQYVNSLNISLVGDVPIFVAADSADTWSKLYLFKTDKEGHFRSVSGVPPDIFSATGQLWGNPVYDWNAMKERGYAWWIKRLERLFHLTDILRIDHFRGFDAYYEIPAQETTAQHGTWVPVDGMDFFRVIKNHFGEVPIIAEDLGLMTDSVQQLRDSNHFPGMKIFQFGFGVDVNHEPNYYDDFLPHNWDENFVAYTGTHDNNTTWGWFSSLDEPTKQMVLDYLGCSNDAVVWTMIRILFLSHARCAVIPMQDVLQKDEKARMNYPSTCNAVNWSWRVGAEEFDAELATRLAALAEISARTGRLADETA